MSKELICLASFFLVLSLAGYMCAAEADAEVAVASVAFGKPVLDGVKDNVWSLSSEQIMTKTKTGAALLTSSADCSGSWWALWDSEYLYVFIDVNDEDLVQDSPPTQGWWDDRVELFIDGDNSKDDAPDGKNDYQYNFRWNFGEVETPVEWYFDASGAPHPRGGSLKGVEYVVVTTNKGYLFEIALPWSTMIGEQPQEGRLIGIDIMIDDDDDGGSYDTVVSWSHTDPAIGSHSPYMWGTASLVVISSEGAYCPNPSDGWKNVSLDAILKWVAGDYADTHDVYFGTVFNDVNDASRDNDPHSVLVSQNHGETTYDPSGLLELGQSYYWRVDEFNDLDPNSPWKGNVWSFTVIDHFVVDDFESYNDLDPSDPNSNRIFLTWIDGYEQPTNGAIVGYADPPFAERGIVHAGRQSMPLFYDNTAGANSEAQRAFSPTQDWTREGVGVLSLWFRGNPAYVGSFAEETLGGTYTMTGSGTDIWDRADEFHFAYKELSGSGAIIAKVESVDNTDPWAKAGVMIRDTLEAGSRNVALLITPENGVRFQYRKTAGMSTDRNFAEGITAPQWVRLERTTGGLVRAYYSADGNTWTLLNMAVVSMDMPVYIGLAVTSHNVDATCEARFSNVSFPDTGVGPQWTDQDIGILSNVSEPMYVTVGDSSGTAATVYHADPDAALTSTWAEWTIDLADFSSQGLVLTDIDKLAIGLGGADNPQPGGSGLMYFDDIRLYLPR